jgi:hypothetical protein
MPRKCLFIALLGLFAQQMGAQQTDYDAIIQPVDAKARDIAEYMVQLAWLNSPEGRIAESELLNSRSENKNTRKEWMRDVNASFNINESNLKGADTLGNVFFPRYNFGLTLNLYNILSQKEKNNIGKRRMDIAEERIHQRKSEIRADALTAWANFRLAREIFKGAEHGRTGFEQQLHPHPAIVQKRRGHPGAIHHHLRHLLRGPGGTDQGPDRSGNRQIQTRGNHRTALGNKCSIRLKKIKILVGSFKWQVSSGKFRVKSCRFAAGLNL